MKCTLDLLPLQTTVRDHQSERISVRSVGTDFEVDRLFLKAQREEKIIKNGKFSGTKQRACIILL